MPSALSPFGRPSGRGRSSGGMSGANASRIDCGHSLGWSGESRGLSGVAATVHPQDLTGDIACLIADEEGAHCGDVLGTPDPAHRGQAGVVLDALAEEALALLP